MSRRSAVADGSHSHGERTTDSIKSNFLARTRLLGLRSNTKSATAAERVETKPPYTDALSEKESFRQR